MLARCHTNVRFIPCDDIDFLRDVFTGHSIERSVQFHSFHAHPFCRKRRRYIVLLAVF